MLLQRKAFFPFLFNCILGFNCQIWGFKAELFWSWEPIDTYSKGLGTQAGPDRKQFSIPKGHCIPSSLHQFLVPPSPPKRQKRVSWQDWDRLSWLPWQSLDLDQGKAVEERTGCGGTSGAASLSSTPGRAINPRGWRVEVSIPVTAQLTLQLPDKS